ncbi:GNAT family N-acetyltransferase [Geomicrobium sp. JSM 1781026]|uniref:GNAT family N-acetyltransferase n=1 Tax=Geomicrobium sp. JSM 1781026 TaxID=3344580 RepID=UPI0035C097D5
MEAIETPRLIIQQLNADHAKDVLEFYVQNQDFLLEWEARKSEDFYTLQAQEKLLLDDQVNFEAGKALKLWIYKKEDDSRIIGCIHFSTIIRSIMQSCFVGYKMDGLENGKGYITEALHAAVDLMFSKYNLHRIEAPIMPRNIASIRVVEKLGFEQDGLTKKMLLVNGVWEDHLRFSLLNPTQTC